MSRVVHFDLPVDNPERATSFYSEVFGWTFEKWDGGDDYWMIRTGKDEEPGIHGGLLRRVDPDHRTTNTISVEDLDKSVADVISKGGAVLVPRMNLPGVGYLACCSDTEKNYFNMIQLDASVTADHTESLANSTAS